ncbi:hypothetical protein J7T55_006898 [Diaporthe amygdali]|uniref:uncharacterized protein n=1 Tax=Phomopsis amygdali TaxID=1214568 RepID=UPI0022FE4208|nr:uncharacterized protein J7T55_006898 [Diaporthe amygdali]KAJ0107020.1 hypothetical protein J7T55_006898 [Diaporthe amygdali]
MRFFAVAGLLSLAAALPTADPSQQDNSVARRGDALDHVLAVRADNSNVGFNPFDQTYSWPDTSVTGGGISAQFRATNLNNGNYSFQFWSSAPLNGGNLSYRVSYGGKELAKVVLSPGQTTTVTVPKTGDNFNIYIDAA